MKTVIFFVLILGVATAEFVSRVAQNYHETVNEKLVQQINLELQASYFYMAYSHYFARADVALHGFAHYFAEMSKEERDHATGLMEYVNKRGGSVSLRDIDYHSMCNTVGDILHEAGSTRTKTCVCHFMSQKTKELMMDDRCSQPRTDWKTGLWAMEDALAAERHVNHQLLMIHESASVNQDPHLTDFLEAKYLDEQVESIKSFADHIRQLERVGDGLGEYMYDQKLKS